MSLAPWDMLEPEVRIIVARVLVNLAEVADCEHMVGILPHLSFPGN